MQEKLTINVMAILPISGISTVFEPAYDIYLLESLLYTLLYFSYGTKNQNILFAFQDFKKLHLCFHYQLSDLTEVTDVLPQFSPTPKVVKCYSQVVKVQPCPPPK